MSEVSIQSENKTQDESSSALTNNISGNNANKEEIKATALTPTKNNQPQVERRSPTSSANDAALDSNSNKNEKPTPVKRTPSKRRSFVERAQRESEELVKNLGGTLDIEGGRKTRSSTRGTPSRANAVATPPPAKKGRATTAAATTTGTPRRGRGRKLDTTVTDVIDSIAENEVSSPQETNSINEKPDKPKIEEILEKSTNDTPNVQAAVENVQIEENKNEDIEMNDISHSPKVPVTLDTSNSNVDTGEITSSVEKKIISNNSVKESANNALKASSPAKVGGCQAAAAAATAVENVDEEKQKLVAAVTADVEPAVEPMEVDGKVSVIKEEEISKNEDSKIEKTDKEISSSSVGNSSSSQSNTAITTKAVSSTTSKLAVQNTSNKIIENIDTTIGDGAPNKPINSIPIKNKIEITVSSPDAVELIDESDEVTVSNEDKNTTTSVVDVPSVTEKSAIAPTPTVTSSEAVTDQKAAIVPPKSATVIEDKSEKSDLCEPKISSPQPPPMSAASETVATPQYCN